ncbi:MAG: sugar ABC transporter ATP-binding protein [Clostridia bacterium]|nr:sugar ABC transporter ATP-binding protein [Clostridia bacterium]
MSDVILELRNICKEFPGVKALDNVSFDLRKGEVHVLLGENGAGKSTLMKVLTGVYHPNSGEIVLHGNKVSFQTPRDAQLARIAIIFQEFNLAPNLTVAQNIFLGREPKARSGLIDRAKMVRDAQEILDFLKVKIDPNAKVETLGVAHQQLVEVAKALSIDSEILIMDEPTATLSENEISALFDTIRNLQKRGVSIIYISHRMQELKVIGNRITVLRDGQTVGTCEASEVTLDELIRMMVGREISKVRTRTENTAREETALEVSHLSQGNKLKDVSIRVQRGEIVGLAGLVGSGRTELAQAVYGITRRDSGDISICGEPIQNPTPIKCIQRRMGFISEDRKECGLALNLPIRVNVTHAGLKSIFPGGIVDVRRERKLAEDYRAKLRIVTPDVERNVVNLSGGNQQKVVLAKWLSTDSAFLVFDEPTRGIDVGAKEEIHNLIRDLAVNGVGILMISSDLPEILTLSDRIYVMREGRIVHEIEQVTSETTQEEIIAYATGGAEQ